MKWSREASLYTLLIIDTAFFFLEIIVGYSVGSLALVADSFHMLNDVVSLVVALYAIKLAANDSSAAYSYGWQRAEVLGALINGVFLIALCFSICLEAVQRLFSTPEISNPRLVVIVGSLGLLSNIIGLFLFHDHGHAHGGGGHSHSHGGESHSHSHSHENGHSHHLASQAEQGLGTTQHSHAPVRPTPETRESVTSEGEEADDLDELLFVHPAQARANLVRAAQEPNYYHHRKRSSSVSGMANIMSNEEVRKHRQSNGPKIPEDRLAEDPTEEHAEAHSHDHSPKGSSHGHDHGSMNMRGVFLHVLGDALGNVGVIAAGLIIWLTSYKWRFYTDPLISLIITIIIFSSALPLVRSASTILLQGTPSSVPLDSVRNAICKVDGVEDVHELHVWSLSESKIIGSVHVRIRSSKDYMRISGRIRELMHEFGIHSITIQPEILGDLKAVVASAAQGQPGKVLSEAQLEAAANSSACLLSCVEACNEDKCCPPPQSEHSDHHD